MYDGVNRSSTEYSIERIGVANIALYEVHPNEQIRDGQKADYRKRDFHGQQRRAHARSGFQRTLRHR